MKNRFRQPAARLFPRASAMLLTLCLAACASVPEQMTQAALEGNTATLGDLLKSGSPEINSPVTFSTPLPSCPGLRTLTPLQAAACSGQVSVIRQLLANKADINLASGAGQTPLLLAIHHGRDQAARVLVEAGARLEMADTAGNTPLLLAVQKGNRELAELLLRNGASPKARNQAGDNALLLSTDATLAKKLAGLGADPLAINANGDSGLHLAARTGNAAMASFFIERGVDVGLQNRDGATALDLARQPARPAETARDKLLTRRRGLPAGAGGTPAVERTGDPAEVVTVIESSIDRSVKQAAASANQAAQQGKSAEALGLYLAALDKAAVIGGPSENEQRLQIIRYTATLPQPPGIPEKAREHLVRSAWLLKKGQDVSLIEKEMIAALRLAPWWTEGYYNLGQLQAEQSKFDAAEQNLKLFIAAAPGDARSQAAQDKLYEIKLAREEEGKIRAMQGRWTDSAGRGYATTIQGDKIQIRSDSGLSFTLTQRNGLLEGSVQGGSYPGPNSCTIPAQMHPVTGRLAPDARGMSLDYQWSSYKTSYHCVNMAGVPSNCCLLCDKVCDAVTVSGTERVNVQLKPAR